MKNFIILLMSALVLSSCDMISGNGNVKKEERNLSSFHGVKSSGSIDVVVRTGDNYEVTVEDDDNILKYVITEVNNGILDVHYKNNTTITNDHAKVYVTAPSLTELTVSGSGDLSSDGVLKSGGLLSFTTSGSGDIKAQVDAPSVLVNGSGSGDVTLAGSTKDFDCKMAGSGDVNCNDLKTENTNVRVAGSSDVHVFASVSLKVNVAGSGDVYYSGNPPNPEIHIAGSGSVKAVK